MLEKKEFLTEDEVLALIITRCSIYWFQLKNGEKTYTEVLKEMGKFLDEQEQKNPIQYQQFIEVGEKKDGADLPESSISVKLREEILGTGNLKKYQKSAR